MESNRISKHLVADKYHTEFDSSNWIKKIPYINFPKSWCIKIIPPFGGAIIRFLVSKSPDEKGVSVYLDGYSLLGAWDEPYWEIYPYKEDVFRCKMNDTDELIKAISTSLRYLK